MSIFPPKIIIHALYRILSHPQPKPTPTSSEQTPSHLISSHPNGACKSQPDIKRFRSQIPYTVSMYIIPNTRNTLVGKTHTYTHTRSECEQNTFPNIGMHGMLRSHIHPHMYTQTLLKIKPVPTWGPNAIFAQKQMSPHSINMGEPWASTYNKYGLVFVGRGKKKVGTKLF